MENYAGLCGKVLSFVHQALVNHSDQFQFANQGLIREGYQALIDSPTLDKLHALVKGLFFHELDVNGDRTEFLIFQFLCFSSFSVERGLKNMSLITQTVAKLQYLTRIAVMYEINIEKNTWAFLIHLMHSYHTGITIWSYPMSAPSRIRPSKPYPI